MAVALPFNLSGSGALPRHLRDMLAHADLLPPSARDAFGIRVYDEDGRVTFVLRPRVVDTVRNAFLATCDGDAKRAPTEIDRTMRACARAIEARDWDIRCAEGLRSREPMDWSFLGDWIVIDDPPFDKATEQLTTDERAELIRRYKLPVRATPPKKLAAARARAAKRRSTAAATNALADRRPLASTAFDVLLRRDAVHRAAGREVLNDLFDEIIDSMPQRYDKTQIRLLLKTYRDEALDKLEASSRNIRQADGDRVGR